MRLADFRGCVRRCLGKLWHQPMKRDNTFVLKKNAARQLAGG